MFKRLLPLLVAPALLVASAAPAQQFPMVDQIAQKIIAKYQGMSCEQLWESKANKAPPSDKEKEAIKILQSDPQMQAEFFRQVSTPIVTKMFQCGMIP